MEIPRLIIAGTHSGVGKTTITTGIMKLFHNAGLRVQGFKVGPDYIDPTYHTQATNRISRNLDTWLLGEGNILELMDRSSADADIAIIEGVMGLFDGFRGHSELGSTAHIAKITKAPVILIIDCKSMARSVAPLVYGFKNFDPEINLAGVILNKVASQRHLEILKEALEPLQVSIVGHVFRDAKLGMPERHLGLVPAEEMDNLNSQLESTANTLKDTLSLNTLKEIAFAVSKITKISKTLFTQSDQDIFKGVRIGYAHDKAFSFYYRDGLDLLEHYGAELIPFSPLKDTNLPQKLNGLILGGGFPELFLDQLSQNTSMIQSIKDANSAGMPIFAECGGFMYLNEEIVDFSGIPKTLVGLIPGKTIMTKKLVSMGYREGELLQSTIIGTHGTKIKGHEFHYSKFEPNNSKDFPWSLNFDNEKLDGFATENLMASYMHFHFASNPQIAKTFLEKCHLYKG